MYNLGLFSTALILMAMDGLNSVNFYKVSIPDRMALVVQYLWYQCGTSVVTVWLKNLPLGILYLLSRRRL